MGTFYTLHHKNRGHSGKTPTQDEPQAFAVGFPYTASFTDRRPESDMVHSMTAFSRQDLDADWGYLQLELRSVNQRYLEPHFRLPETLRDLEPDFREALRGRLARGKVECHLRFTPATGDAQLSVNRTRLEALANALADVRAGVPQAAMPDALALLNHPGVLEIPGPDMDIVKSEARVLFRSAWMTWRPAVPVKATSSPP